MSHKKITTVGITISLDSLGYFEKQISKNLIDLNSIYFIHQEADYDLSDIIIKILHKSLPQIKVKKFSIDDFSEESKTVYILSPTESKNQHLKINYDKIIDLTANNQANILQDQKLNLYNTHSTEIVWSFDINTKELIVSDNFHTIFGYEQTLVLSKPEAFFSLVHPDDKKIVFEFAKDTIPETLYIRIKHAKGNYIAVSVSCVFNESTKKYSGVVKNIQEITLLKQQTERAAYLLSDLQNLSRSGSWEYYPEEQELLLTRETCLLLNVNEQTDKIRLDDFFCYMHKDDHANFLKSAFNALASTKSSEIKLRFVKNDTQFLHVICRVKPIVKNGRLIKIAGVFTDITQILEYEQKLEEKNKALEQMQLELEEKLEELSISNEYLENFVFTVAHDLRAPIANCCNLIDLLLLEDNNNIVIEKLKISIQRLERTVNGLIKVTDTKNEQEIIIEHIYFQDLLNKIVEENKEMCTNKNVTLTTDFKIKQIGYVEMYLSSILYNLVCNAIKYTPDSRNPLLHISTKKEKGHILLSVQDNGSGIDPEYIKQIFKPFFRIDKTEEGKGLGLYLVRSTVEKNGGKIEIKSIPGEGTLFNVYLKPYHG